MYIWADKKQRQRIRRRVSSISWFWLSANTVKSYRWCLFPTVLPLFIYFFDELKRHLLYVCHIINSGYSAISSYNLLMLYKLPMLYEKDDLHLRISPVTTISRDKTTITNTAIIVLIVPSEFVISEIYEDKHCKKCYLSFNSNVLYITHSIEQLKHTLLKFQLYLWFAYICYIEKNMYTVVFITKILNIFTMIT